MKAIENKEQECIYIAPKTETIVINNEAAIIMMSGENTGNEPVPGY
jgi:hypothetical protein